MKIFIKKKLKCFRLHPVDIKRLQKASLSLGLCQTGIVERALEQFFMNLNEGSARRIDIKTKK